MLQVVKISDLVLKHKSGKAKIKLEIEFSH